MGSTARRGLAFADQRNTRLPPVEHLNTVPNNSSHHELALGMTPNALQSGYTKSAFQPVQGGLRPHQEEVMSRNENSVLAPPTANMLANMSSCNDIENMFAKPVSHAKVPIALLPETTPANDTVFTRETSTGNKFSVFSRTPDINRSGDFNSSNLTGPSPTLFTKQALMVVGDMFSGPLESERDLTLGGAQEMDQTDKDFEAAFSSDCTTRTSFSGGFAGVGRYCRLREVSTFGNRGSGVGEIHARAKFHEDATRGSLARLLVTCLLAGGDFLHARVYFTRFTQIRDRLESIGSEIK